MIKMFLEDIGQPRSTTWAPLYEGIVSNDRVVMVDSMDDADYCVFHFQGRNENMPLEKTIYVDTDDKQQLQHNHKVKLYLKRSMVSGIQKDGTRIKHEYPEYVKPFSHSCVLNDLKNKTSSFNEDRMYDVISTFREPSGPWDQAEGGYHYPSNYLRTDLQKKLRKVFLNSEWNISFEEFNDSNSGDFETSYINHLKNSKIIVTMNPSCWEGDNRLYESLACGAMVFCDQLYVDIPDKFIDGKHLIYYNALDVDALYHQILYYLENQDELNRIARAGYEFVQEFHSSSGRIDQILNYLDS